MARTSKGALRAYMARLFRNLAPTQRKQALQAITDLDNLESFHSLNQSSDILARRPDEFVLGTEIEKTTLDRPEAQSILTQEIWGNNVKVTKQVYGLLISWERMPDPRIQFYEIQVADDPAFSNFNTYSTQEFTFTVAGIQRTKYIRIRGVRRDGSCTVWSNTVSEEPKVIDIRVHAQGYDGEANSGGTVAGFWYGVLSETISGSGFGYSGFMDSSEIIYTAVNQSATSTVFGGGTVYIRGPTSSGFIGKLELLINDVVFEVRDLGVPNYDGSVYNLYTAHYNCDLGPIPFDHDDPRFGGNPNFRIKYRITSYDLNFDVYFGSHGLYAIEFGL